MPKGASVQPWGGTQALGLAVSILLTMSHTRMGLASSLQEQASGPGLGHCSVFLEFRLRCSFPTRNSCQGQALLVLRSLPNRFLEYQELGSLPVGGWGLGGHARNQMLISYSH